MGIFLLHVPGIRQDWAHPQPQTFGTTGPDAKSVSHPMSQWGWAARAGVVVP